MSLPVVVVARGREKSLLRRHPWVFSGAVARVEGAAAAGDVVDVASADGAWLGRGWYSPKSRIPVRVLTFDAAEAVDAAFLAGRVARAVAARRADAGGACRLVFSESDGLPGLVADRYASVVVVQLLTAGAERHRAVLAAALAEATGAATVYERSDADVREREGLPRVTGLVAGPEPPPLVKIDEAGCRYLVDVRAGHKTGFYLDQAVNRGVVRALADGADVLNAFAYTGGFGVAALAGDARHVVHLDTSAPALDLARRNIALNGFDPVRSTFDHSDAFRRLRRMDEEGRRFDLVVLDPPKFADHRAGLEGAARGYKDVNRLGFRLLRPGGRLVTFSCSGLLETALFQKIVADAALDAGVEAVIETRLSQAPDHPTALPFPEATYLKGLVVRVR